MCKNAESQVLNIAQVSESTIIILLTEAKVITTAQGQTIQTDFTAAITAIQNWKAGTPATDISEIITAIQSNLQLIPIPAPLNLLIPAALAGLQTILSLLGANSPAPVAAGVEATTEAVAAHQMFHAHAVAADGEAKVAELTGYKPSMWDKARAASGDTHVASDAYIKHWDATVEKNGLPEELKVA